MARSWRRILGLGALAGTALVVLRSIKMFLGSPEGVGQESFGFEPGSDDPYAIDESTLGGEVPAELLASLRCPVDKGPLVLVDGKWLVNPRLGYRYPIVEGIPIMLTEVGERYRDPTWSPQPEPERPSSQQGGSVEP